MQSMPAPRSAHASVEQHSVDPTNTCPPGQFAVKSCYSGVLLACSLALETCDPGFMSVLRNPLRRASSWTDRGPNVGRKNQNIPGTSTGTQHMHTQYKKKKFLVVAFTCYRAVFLPASSVVYTVLPRYFHDFLTYLLLVSTDSGRSV